MPLIPGSYAAKFHAHELQRAHASGNVGKLAGLLFDAQVEPKPHQIDAALFALKTPFLKGVILADEVGLGKTIEAGIVISQYWAERKRRILIIAPSSLRQQWRQELDEKFALPAQLLDKNTLGELLTPNAPEQILICSYEFANKNRARLARAWDLLVCDEAHRLRSHWTVQAKTPQAVAAISNYSKKTVMLTATPLQNRLEELYGLVSVFDPNFFYSLDAFKERYLNNPNGIGNDDLAQRVATLAKRTLRKDADKYIRFTQRMAMTVAFTPSEEEQHLYELINSYLQRPYLYAFARSQRHLSALIMRKRLGSSSFAVASTLENTAARLESELLQGKRRNDAGAFLEDIDLTSDITEAQERIRTEEGNDTTPRQPAPSSLINAQDREAMAAEVAELRDYSALARSITDNEKAKKLLEALEQGFDKLREIGAPEKAIIFTDSTVTQDYLARTLRANGWAEGLVLFNGTNTSPEAQEIYQRWLEENAGKDIITGIPAADRRKALVDEFKHRGTLMIATEAASEGINLQFCSMLVNYDLPWNPQRIEQRIGRVHRFGQQHNVIVVNFSNKGNLAEERILELLSEKFHLFTSVFGASDEVLGQIEDGLAFEQNIVAILEHCKSAEEINAAFDELERRYASHIDSEMKKTRKKVFDNLDPKVRDKLKSYDTQTRQTLNTFERLLMSVTEYALREYADFDDNGMNFTLFESPEDGIPTGEYYLKKSPQGGQRLYRYRSQLCQWVLSQATNTPTPPARLTFSLDHSPRVPAPLRRLKGCHGSLVIDEGLWEAKAGEHDLTESRLLMVGRTENGEKLDEEHIRDLMALTCINAENAQVDTASFESELANMLEDMSNEVNERNTTYLYQEEEAIEAKRRDLAATYAAKIRELESKERAAQNSARKEQDSMTRLKLTREARSYRRKIEELDEEARTHRDKLRAESDRYLDAIEAALIAQASRKRILEINWEII